MIGSYTDDRQTRTEDITRTELDAVHIGRGH
jgi:hypothetical protein